MVSEQEVPQPYSESSSSAARASGSGQGSPPKPASAPGQVRGARSTAGSHQSDAPGRLPGADELIEGLDPEQQQVALALRGPVCVLAGAGTGKTRAITHRIAYGVRTGVYVPTNVLAVTFTARAAGEMRTRLRDLGVPGVQARTFHAAAVRQLNHFWPKVVGGAPWRILEHKAQVVAEAARRIGISVDRIAVRDLASEIEWAKVSIISPDDYALACARIGREAPAGYDATTVARLFETYEVLKAERTVADFEDVLLLVAQMLADYPEVGDEVRKQYKHFVVDEYQDVSALQQRLLDQWLGGRQELCVVGDPSQTIYSFAGATPDYLLNFRRDRPSAQEVRLVRDYRSTPQIVGLANDLLAPRRGVGRVAHQPLELVAQRPSGRPVVFTSYSDDEAEAAGIAERAANLIRQGISAHEIAVLYRTNAQSEAFEQALSAAGVGYVIRGGERFFQRKDVRDAIVLLRGAAHSAADRPMTEAVRETLALAGWTPEPPAARGAARERWDALQALVALADDLAQRRGAGLPELLSDLADRSNSQHAPTVDGVTLASLHAAKGLEWDAVFLAGVSEGLMPISLAETDDAIAEERRLLYVGVTRARLHLELSYASARNPGGRHSRKATRFLDGIWPIERPAARTRTRERSAVHLTGEADAKLFEKLRAWRLALATESGKPAFTVLGNAPLAAIAEAKPTSMADLARIHGMGPMKLEQYGEALLSLVKDHRDDSV